MTNMARAIIMIVSMMAVFALLQFCANMIGGYR
jgi:hypothetical protein